MITGREGVEFLQRCLPRLHLRWRGFRKVRRQVLQAPPSPSAGIGIIQSGGVSKLP